MNNNEDKDIAELLSKIFSFYMLMMSDSDYKNRPEYMARKRLIKMKDDLLAEVSEK